MVEILSYASTLKLQRLSISVDTLSMFSKEQNSSLYKKFTVGYDDDDKLEIKTKDKTWIEYDKHKFTVVKSSNK